MSIKTPKGEILWVTFYDSEGNARFFVTSKAIRDVYYLYECTDDGYKKLGKLANPLELVQKYDVDKKIGVKT